jgi:hypothetical protein
MHSPTSFSSIELQRQSSNERYDILAIRPFVCGHNGVQDMHHASKPASQGGAARHAVAGVRAAPSPG